MTGVNKGRRILVRGAIAATGLLVATGAASGAFLARKDFGGSATGERLARMMASPHWVDGKFQNLEPMQQPLKNRSSFTVMRDFLLDRSPERYPQVPIPHGSTRLVDLPAESLAWLGHSGFVIRFEGLTILIDPALHAAFPCDGFYEPFSGADAYRAENLPDADVLLITHDHYDHLDYQTVMNLKRRVRRVICPLGVGAHFEAWGWESERITELDWWEETRVGPLRVVAVPGQHFSGRSLHRNQTLWAGYVVEANGFTLYHSGDTSEGGHFTQIRRAFSRIDLALLEDGQYSPDWPGVHLLPDAWRRTVRMLAPSAVLAMHNSRYCISHHAWRDPLDQALASSREVGVQLLTPRIGDVVALDPAQRTPFAPWWLKMA